MMQQRVFVILALAVASCEGFSPATARASPTSSTTQLQFGIPSFGAKEESEEKKDDAIPEKKIGMSGLMQLVTAGLGSPFLGDYEGVDEETGNFMFSLEANNLVDEKGESRQTKMPYFENGWVDEEDAKKAEEKKKGGFKFW